MDSIAEWNIELQQCLVDIESKRKLERRRNQLESEMTRQRRMAEESLRVLQKEEEDVRKLASSSLSQFWFSLFGKLDDKLGEEEREAAEAKLKHDAAQAALKRMEEERTELDRGYAEVESADFRLERLKKAKEEWIFQHDETKRIELEALSQRIAAVQAQLKETGEAEHAGEGARDALSLAEDRLGSAKNWGTYDMLGGGMISTMIKHDRIDEARDHIHEAQYHLRRFAEELKDLKMSTGPNGPEIGGFLTFADYFFDGFITDWIVQGKINDSLESLRSNQNEVSGILGKLADMKRQMENELTGCKGLYDQSVQQYGG